MRVLFYSTAAGFVATRLEPVPCPDGAGCSSEFKDIYRPRRPRSREPTIKGQIAALRPGFAGRVWRFISSRSQFSASRTMVERSSWRGRQPSLLRTRRTAPRSAPDRRSARRHLDLEIDARDALDRFDHVQHREAVAVAAIERQRWRAGAPVAQRIGMRLHQIADMDVIADAGTVGIG